MATAVPSIGLNLAYLQPGRLGGTETYARELIRELQQQNSEFQFVLFLNPESFETFECQSPNFRKVLVPISAESPAKRHILEQSLMPRYAARERVNLLHSLSYVVPLLARCEQIVTVHDMLYAVHPELLTKAKRNFWRFFVPRSVRRASRTITVSEASRKDIVRYCGVDESRVVAIPLGVRSSPRAAKEEIEQVLAKYEVEPPYALAVGCGKHKGVDRIERACELLNKQFGQELKLVITGLPESRTVPPRSKDVAHLGFVPSDELRALYAGATVYVSASRMEGFGLTLLESMMQGTPVVSSTAGSLPEVGGDAMLAVADPTPEALASAIARVVRDADLRAGMVEAGFRRVEQFQWSKTASRHLELYGELLGRHAAFPNQLSMASN